MSSSLQFNEIAADHRCKEGAKAGHLKFRYLNMPSSKSLLHKFLTVPFPLSLKTHFWVYLSSLRALVPVVKDVLTSAHQPDMNLDHPQRRRYFQVWTWKGRQRGVICWASFEQGYSWEMTVVTRYKTWWNWFFRALFITVILTAGLTGLYGLHTGLYWLHMDNLQKIPACLMWEYLIWKLKCALGLTCPKGLCLRHWHNKDNLIICINISSKSNVAAQGATKGMKFTAANSLGYQTLLSYWRALILK